MDINTSFAESITADKVGALQVAIRLFSTGKFPKINGMFAYVCKTIGPCLVEKFTALFHATRSAEATHQEWTDRQLQGSKEGRVSIVGGGYKNLQLHTPSLSPKPQLCCREVADCFTGRLSAVLLTFLRDFEQILSFPDASVPHNVKTSRVGGDEAVGSYIYSSRRRPNMSLLRCLTTHFTFFWGE